MITYVCANNPWLVEEDAQEVRSVRARRELGLLKPRQKGQVPDDDQKNVPSVHGRIESDSRQSQDE